MLGFHVKITDNETGEVLNDLDTNCIIGAFGSDTGALEVSNLDCRAITIVATVHAALKAVERTCAIDPEISFLCEQIIKKGGIFKDE